MDARAVLGVDVCSTPDMKIKPVDYLAAWWNV